MYAVKDRQLYINLFAGNTATMQVGGKDVVLEQQTCYPWDGDITITVKKKPGEGIRYVGTHPRMGEWHTSTQ